MTKFIISAIGSYGDVYPMVGLGAALGRRGHVVKLITNPYFADHVAAAGLELLPIGTRENYVELTQHPDLWRPIRGPKLIMKHATVRFLRPIYDLIRAHHVPGETVIGAHALDLGSRVAAEKLGAPVAAVVFAPALIWSLHDSPRIKGAVSGPRVPRWLKLLQYWASDRLFVLPLVGAELNGLRRELGLSPVRRVFGKFMYQCDMLLGLFPDWFGPPQPDWPANARLVGFPLWDAPGSISAGSVPISAGSVPIFCSEKMGTDPFARNDLEEFLSADSPPIAFSPGSANREAQPFFAAAVDACQRLGRRGILLTKYADQLPPNLPPSVRHFGFVPMSRLLPHTAALVHHGGVGSCAQAFAAGVPQLVRPMSYDQFDNSRRVVRLGVGEEISVRQTDGAAIAAAIDRLLASPEVAAKCRDYAARCNGPAALEAACDALEELPAAAK